MRAARADGESGSAQALVGGGLSGGAGLAEALAGRGSLLRVPLCFDAVVHAGGVGQAFRSADRPGEG